MSEHLESIRIIYYISTDPNREDPEKITGAGRAQNLLTERGVFLGGESQIVDNGSTLKLTLLGLIASEIKHSGYFDSLLNRPVFRDESYCGAAEVW